MNAATSISCFAAFQLTVKALHVRPESGRSPQECCLRVSLMPLRLNIDQVSCANAKKRRKKQTQPTSTPHTTPPQKKKNHKKTPKKTKHNQSDKTKTQPFFIYLIIVEFLTDICNHCTHVFLVDAFFYGQSHISLDLYHFVCILVRTCFVLQLLEKLAFFLLFYFKS